METNRKEMFKKKLLNRQKNREICTEKTIYEKLNINFRASDFF